MSTLQQNFFSQNSIVARTNRTGFPQPTCPRRLCELPSLRKYGQARAWTSGHHRDGPGLSRAGGLADQRLSNPLLRNAVWAGGPSPPQGVATRRCRVATRQCRANIGNREWTARNCGWSQCARMRDVDQNSWPYSYHARFWIPPARCSRVPSRSALNCLSNGPAWTWRESAHTSRPRHSGRARG